MSDEIRLRKDGRPLVTEHQVTAEDYIEIIDASEIPAGAIACRFNFRREDEGWTDDF